MLSQATGNAAMALSFLAASGGKPMLVREIAAACDLPAPYLSKIVHHLARADLVITQRGVGGGVQLAAPPESISLYKLCEVLGDPAIECRCMLGNAECSQERACPAHEFWSECRRQQLEFLQTTMISDLADYELRARFAGPLPATTSEDPAAARA